MRIRASVWRAVAMAAVTASGLVSLGGCKQDDGLKPEQRVVADRFDEIARKSGGDLDKLSPADRDYMVKDVAHGSEQAARMMLAAKAGRLKGRPGAPTK